MKKITEFKIRVTPEQSEIVQKTMIKLNQLRGELIQYDQKYLFVYYDMIRHQMNDRDYFNNHELPELTFSEWQQMYMPQEKKIMGLEYKIHNDDKYITIQDAITLPVEFIEKLHKELQKPKTKTKEEILEETCFDICLEEEEWNQIANVMQIFAEQETKKEAAIRIIEAIGTMTILTKKGESK